MPVKTKKIKQKQKQRQHQNVIVNVHQARAPARRRRAPSRRSGGGNVGVGGGGGVGAFSSPIYLNSPADLSPIIQNLPAQYQHLPAITMPTNTAPQPSLQALTYPTPTTLQTATADVRPLGASARGGSPFSPMSPMLPVSIDIDTPRPRLVIPRPSTNQGLATIAPPMNFLQDLQRAQASRAMRDSSLGATTLGSNITPSRSLTPFQEELQASLSNRSSRQSTPTQFTNTPSSSPLLIRPIPIRATPSPSPRLPRRLGIEVAEARAMGLEDRPPRPRGRPVGS